MKNGLAFVTTPGLVGVHDGVRPFVAREVIARCYSLAAEKQAVVPVTDVVETVRHLVGEGSETVSRDEYKLVQTPQVFDADLLNRLTNSLIPRTSQTMLRLLKHWASLFI